MWNSTSTGSFNEFGLLVSPLQWKKLFQAKGKLKYKNKSAVRLAATNVINEAEFSRSSFIKNCRSNMTKPPNRRKDSLNSPMLSQNSINDLSKLAMKNIKSYEDDFEISQSESSAINKSLLFDQNGNEIVKNPRKHRPLPKLRTNLKEKPTKQPYKLKMYSVFFN